MGRLNFATQSVQPGGAINSGELHMRTFVAALAFAVVAGPALAQMPAINMLDQGKPKTQEEIERGHAIDDAYKSVMKKVPDQKKTTNDPWADVRGSGQPSTVQKQGRTGSTAKSN